MKTVFQTIFFLFLLVHAAYSNEAQKNAVQQKYLYSPLPLIPEISEGSKPANRYEIAYIIHKAFPLQVFQDSCMATDIGLDVPAEHWARDSIVWGCRSEGIGIYPTGDYEGNRIQTRYEDSSVFWSLLLYLEEVYLIEFPKDTYVYPDVPPDHWISERVFSVSLFFKGHTNGLWEGSRVATFDEIRDALNGIITYINEKSPLIDRDIKESIDISAPCPATMAYISHGNKVENDYCIDPFEYPNVKGKIPYGYMTDKNARFICELEGKRLCKAAEWQQACMGQDKTKYIYGDTYMPGFCNDGLLSREQNYIRMKRMKESGNMPGCHNEKGIFDMNGSVGEWVESTEAGSSRLVLMGGSFSKKSGEEQASCLGMMAPDIGMNGNMSLRQEYEAMGVRCCMDSRVQE